MRITVLVRVLMMNAVRGYPENWSTFERQSRAYGQEILHPLGSFVAAMGEQPVIAHTDAQTPRHPPEEHRDQQRLPGEEKDGGDCAQMKCGHEAGCDPVDFAIRSGFPI